MYKKPDRVHALHGDVGETRSTQGESLEWDLPPDDDLVDDNGDLPNDGLGDHDEVGERNSGNPGNTTEEYNVPADLGDDAWLAAIQYTSGKKSVCFQFAKEGRCEFMEKMGKCIYSHDAENSYGMGSHRVF